jgi:hypothetical protein
MGLAGKLLSDSLTNKRVMHMADSLRVSFRRAELIELWRALELITQEDKDCNINVDKASQTAKAGALAKINKALNWKDPSPNFVPVDLVPK